MPHETAVIRAAGPRSSDHWRCDGARTGELTGRETVASFGDGDFPDGLALDAEVRDDVEIKIEAELFCEKLANGAWKERS